MKILSDKDQLRNKIQDVEYAINYAGEEYTKANNRVKRKDNWGFLSFVFEPYWLLILTRNIKLDILNLLKEYRDTLIKELTK